MRHTKDENINGGMKMVNWEDMLNVTKPKGIKIVNYILENPTLFHYYDRRKDKYNASKDKREITHLLCILDDDTLSEKKQIKYIKETGQLLIKLLGRVTEEMLIKKNESMSEKEKLQENILRRDIAKIYGNMYLNDAFGRRKSRISYEGFHKINRKGVTAKRMENTIIVKEVLFELVNFFDVILEENMIILKEVQNGEKGNIYSKERKLITESDFYKYKYIV